MVVWKQRGQEVGSSGSIEADSDRMRSAMVVRTTMDGGVEESEGMVAMTDSTNVMAVSIPMIVPPASTVAHHAPMISGDIFSIDVGEKRIVSRMDRMSGS